MDNNCYLSTPLYWIPKISFIPTVCNICIIKPTIYPEVIALFSTTTGSKGICIINFYNLLGYSVPLMCIQCNLNTLNAIYVSQVLLKCLPCLHSFCTPSLMYICTTRYLCNAIQHIVLEMSCGFSLFPHFQITFPSVVLDIKRLSQNIPNKMISKENFNIEKPRSAHLLLK